MRGYPAALVLEAFCLGLARSKKWTELRRILKTDIVTRQEYPKNFASDVFPVSWEGGDNRYWNLLPEFGGQNMKTPLSDHLFGALFLEWARSFWGTMTDFEETFELLDVLAAFVFIERDSKEALKEAILAGTGARDCLDMPLGRDGWNSQIRGRLLKKLENPEFKKELLDAGFANSDAEYFDLILENYRRRTRMMSFFSSHW